MALKFQSKFVTASERFTPADVSDIIELHAIALQHMAYGKPTKQFAAWASAVTGDYSEVHAFLNAVENGTPWPPLVDDPVVDAVVDANHHFE